MLPNCLTSTPDGKDLGTGSFKTVTKHDAFSSKKAISSIMANFPVFKILVNLNPATGETLVLLGRADASDPTSRKVYIFPENISVLDLHEFEVTFENWEITGLQMDKVLLNQSIRTNA
jgi:hypothetical protein